MTALRIPRGALDRFDAILVEPVPKSRSRAVWEALHSVNGASSRRATVALRAGSDWGGRELEAVRECGHWLFLDRKKTLRTGRRIMGNEEMPEPVHCPCPLKKALGSCRRVAALGACLKEKLGSCRLVTGMGACAALMPSRTLQIEYFPTAPICSPGARGSRRGPPGSNRAVIGRRSLGSTERAPRRRCGHRSRRGPPPPPKLRKAGYRTMRRWRVALAPRHTRRVTAGETWRGQKMAAHR